MDATDLIIRREGTASPCIGLTSDALPEVQTLRTMNSQTGVSTHNVSFGNDRNWYTLRCTYGQEKKAYEDLTKAGVTVFYPTITRVKLIDGKRRKVEESRLPNLLFAYSTFDELKVFVYDNIRFSYLRFYYRHYHVEGRIEKEPLIVPQCQMQSFKLICGAEKQDIIITPDTIRKFQEGEWVRVIEGPFKGVIGRVARYQGQQRVGIILDGLLTAITAYVPSGFLESYISFKKCY